MEWLCKNSFITFSKSCLLPPRWKLYRDHSPRSPPPPPRIFWITICVYVARRNDIFSFNKVGVFSPCGTRLSSVLSWVAARKWSNFIEKFDKYKCSLFWVVQIFNKIVFIQQISIYFFLFPVLEFLLNNYETLLQYLEKHSNSIPYKLPRFHECHSNFFYLCCNHHRNRLWIQSSFNTILSIFSL